MPVFGPRTQAAWQFPLPDSGGTLTLGFPSCHRRSPETPCGEPLRLQGEGGIPAEPSPAYLPSRWKPS